MVRSKTKQGKAKGQSALEKARGVPWAALLQVGVVLQGRWRRLSEKDRERVVAMMRQSQGRLGRLGTRERGELRRLVRKADLKGLGPELLALRGARRRRKHR
jgi:hypothetical protein